MKNNKGYTLIELIITLAIIGIMVIPIFDAFLEANRVNLRSRRQISAAYLAQNELEGIKGKTRSEFEAFDIAGGVDITDPTWSRTMDPYTILNGNTNFTVETTLSNITDEFGIDLESTSAVNNKDERTFDVRLTLSEATNNLAVRSDNTGTSSVNSAGTVYLLFRSDTENSSNMVVVDSELALIAGLPIFSINTSSSDNFDDLIVLNVNGYSKENVDPMGNEWTIHIINQSDWTIDAKPFIDDGGKIKLKSDSRSTKNIYIGNSFPVATGDPSTVREYFRIIIEVSYINNDGEKTVFETIESTVGK